jgi:hypothetical protein
MKKLAIVGTHPATRGLAPFDDPDYEIWVFNEAIPGRADWCKRMPDADFNMHKPEGYQWVGYADKSGWTWLQSNKDVIVWMLETDERVPMGRKYPLDNICKMYLSRIDHGPEQFRYFTSSVCYALALALYQNYKDVTIYGVEMETSAEYVYQRDGISLWIGIATQHGVTVHLPESCALMSAPLYGYDEETSMIGSEQFEDRCNQLAPEISKAQAVVTGIQGELEAYVKIINDKKAGKAPEAELIEIANRINASTQELINAVGKSASLQGMFMESKMWLGKLEAVAAASGGEQVVSKLIEANAGRRQIQLPEESIVTPPIGVGVQETQGAE